MFPPTSGPGLAASRDRAKAAVGALTAVDVTEVGGADLAAHLPGLYRLRAMVDAAIVDAVDTFDGRKQWAVDGAFSASGWIAARTGTTRAGAAATVKTARQARHMPAAVGEAKAGRLSADQLRILAAARGTSETTAKEYDDDETRLVGEVASRDVETAARLMRAWIAAADPDADDDAHSDREEKRKVNLSTSLDGMGFLDGLLTTEANAVLAAQLEAIIDDLHRWGLSVGADGTRLTAAQLRHDALVEMARRAGASATAVHIRRTARHRAQQTTTDRAAASADAASAEATDQAADNDESTPDATAGCDAPTSDDGTPQSASGDAPSDAGPEPTAAHRHRSGPATPTPTTPAAPADQPADPGPASADRPADTDPADATADPDPADQPTDTAPASPVGPNDTADRPGGTAPAPPIRPNDTADRAAGIDPAPSTADPGTSHPEPDGTLSLLGPDVDDTDDLGPHPLGAGGQGPCSEQTAAQGLLLPPGDPPPQAGPPSNLEPDDKVAGGLGRPLFTVLIDLNTLEGRDPTDLLTRRAEIPGIGALPTDAILRYLCDAGVSRVVTRGQSLPLDVGAVSRTATPAQWRALITHSSTCEFPGCTAPWEWCEAHHLTHWTAEHRTALEGLALGCTGHHHLLHKPGWSMTRNPDLTTTVTRPDGTTLTSHTL